MAEEFKYWAFISYSHGDEAFAAKLHKSLEQYSLPLNVRRAHNLPRRLIPIFRDMDELEAASHLTAKLERALDQSRWLIVICSPRAAASRYVNQEVDYFVARHGVDQVLCVLAEGDPPECFPEAVRNLGVEPLAADCRAGKDIDAAKLKLIAAMAVVGFTDLRNREAQRRRRERIAIASAAAMAALGAVTYWDLFVRTHVDYYANYVRVNGIWQGVDPISAAGAERRSASYRFTRHGRLRPPERVDYFHGCGSVEKPGMADIADSATDAEDHARVLCTAAFEYHGDGSIASEALLNAYGAAISTLTYTTPTLAQFTFGGFASANSASGMRYVQLERDARGRDRAMHFLYAQDMPRANDRDHFGYHFEYDDAGRMLRRSVLDDAGTETGESTLYRYDVAGNLIELAYVDGAGKPSTGRAGYASIRYDRDADGNEIAESYYDEAGQPTIDEEGVFRHAYSFDGHGNFTEERYLDGSGKPMLSIDGVAGIHDRYDARGFLVRREFLDTDGRLTRDVQGYAINVSEYDAHGSCLVDRFFDADGKPTSTDLGFAIARDEFDEQGRQIAQHFFGVDDKPTTTRWGATLRDTFNARGQIMSIAFFDADGKPFTRPDRGYARFEYQRDETGVNLQTTFFDANLQPRRSRTQPAYRQFKHDAFGRVTEWRNLDADRKPMRIAEGYAIESARYDRQGNQIEHRYYDADESPIAIPVEGFGWTAQYDHQGRATLKTFLDRDGKAAEGDRGYASVRYAYGVGQRVLSESYLDAAGNVITGHRVAAANFRYDSRGRQIEQRYLDGDGAPVPGPLGYASLQTEYDDSGRLVAERHLDASGKPIDNRVAGWATHFVSYGSDGLKNRYLSAAGAEVTPKP